MLIIGQVSGKDVYEQQFELSFGRDVPFQSNYFIERLAKAWIITHQNDNVFKQVHYGMIPYWSRKPLVHFESPVEGSENPGSERLKRRIIIHPSYRKPIRENRCLIPVDYVIVPNDEGDPFLLFSDVSKTFALAGIYDNWKEDYYQKEFYQGFSVLTVPSSDDYRKFGINRLPLILTQRLYKRWLNPDTPLAEIIQLMEIPVEKKLNGYPVRRSMYREACNSNEICNPVGNLIRETMQGSSKITDFLHSFHFNQGTPTHQNT